MKLFWFLVLMLMVPSVLAAQGDPDHRENLARLHTELGAAYYARAQYGVALEEIKLAHEASAEYAGAYTIEGLVYMDLREFDKADHAFLRALALSPADPDANHNYGWFLCNRRDRYSDSLKYFMAAVKNPLYTTPQKSLQQAGVCALKAGDAKAAEDYLRQADRAQPNNPETLLGLARLVYERGDFSAARTLLMQAARVGSATAESLWLNVRIEHKLGNADAEAGFVRELRNRFPESEEARRLAKGQYD